MQPEPSGPRRGGPAARTRPQLDEDTILDAARLLTATSTESLTVRRLGQALGADPTAIYRHFRDKDELVRGLIDRLLADTLQRVDLSVDWRTRLTRLAAATLESFVSHPAVGAEAATTSTGGPNEVKAISLILEAMKDAGLGSEDAVRYYGVYSSYVLSLAGAQARHRLENGGSADDTYQDPWIGPSTVLRSSRFPVIAEVRDELEQLHQRDIFEDGVQIILDAVQARSEVRSQRRKPTAVKPATRRRKASDAAGVH